MNKNRLYFFAFLEGAFVVSVELMGGKLLSPVFGSSLYIWTSVIGVTLLSLTIGYFIGGLLSAKPHVSRILNTLFSIAAIYAIAMPVITQLLLKTFLTMSLFKGCISMAFLLLSCPLICLGATSPIIIQLCRQDVNSAGRVAGQFYALSTIGGVINTFLLGFYIIPAYGISLPLFVSGLVIILSTLLISQISSKSRIPFFLIFIAVTTRLFFLINKKEESAAFKDIYESEGIMGQLKVVDYYSEGILNRALLTNNSAQSIIAKTNVTALSQYNYVHFVSAVSTLKPENSTILMLGMAGGSLVYELQKQGFNIDVVDIDERMFYIAERYFYFQKSKTNLFTDDARHFIRTSKKKYDIVIIDISSSEVQPSYLYTTESFTEIRNILSSKGLFFINFQGVLQGSSNLAVATWSIYKTLNKSGLKPYYYSFSENKTDDVQFVSSPEAIDFTKLDSTRVNLCCTQNKFVEDVFRRQSLDSSTAICKVEPLVLTDDKPLLEELKFEANIEYRNGIRQEMKKRESLIKKN